MISDRLRHAPDLVSKAEYATVDGHRRLIATVYSSRRFGLKEREEYPAKTVEVPSASEPAQAGDDGRGPSKKNRKAAESAATEESKERV